MHNKDYINYLKSWVDKHNFEALMDHKLDASCPDSDTITVPFQPPLYEPICLDTQVIGSPSLRIPESRRGRRKALTTHESFDLTRLIDKHVTLFQIGLEDSEDYEITSQRFVFDDVSDSHFLYNLHCSQCTLDE